MTEEPCRAFPRLTRQLTRSQSGRTRFVHRPVSATTTAKNTPTTKHRANHRYRLRLHTRGKLIAGLAIVTAAAVGGWSLAGALGDKPATGDSETTITTVAKDSPAGYETGLQFVASAS